MITLKVALLIFAATLALWLTVRNVLWPLFIRLTDWLFESLHDGRTLPVWPYLMGRK